MVYSTLLTAQPMFSGSSFKHGSRTLQEDSSGFMGRLGAVTSLIMLFFGKTVENSGAVD